MSPPAIYYIRHGQTDWNAELRYQGRMDIPLNDKGRAQALRNGRKLKALLEGREDLKFVASPLARARETMEIIRQQLHLPAEGYVVDDRLVEASYGDLEGRTLADFKASNPEVYRKRKLNRWYFQPPGGESQQMVLERVRAWADGLDGDTVVAGHGVVGRVLRHLLVGIEQETAAGFVFPQDRIFIWRDGSEELV